MKFCQTNVQPYFSGVGVGTDKQHFLEEIKKFSHKQYQPPIIANAENLPIGIYRVTYKHANFYHELQIHLWGAEIPTKAILAQIINQSLHKEHPEGRILIELPGYAPELIHAAENLGLELAGRIPNYICHNDELHHKYFFVMSSEKWHDTQKES